jgi:uncharacterized protein
MVATKDRNGLIVLDRQACLDRLASRRVGTIALTEGALPVAVPTVYTLFGTDVVISADPTSLLGRRLPDAIVSLCVQDVPDDLTGGWNVTVIGCAEIIHDPAILDALPWDRLPSWGSAPLGPTGNAGGRVGSIVARLGTERVTGRVVPSNWHDERSTERRP